jgi:ribonuclease P protein component
MEALHRSIFLKELKEAFPPLRDAINAQYGLLHLEVHAFTDFVQHAIADGDKETVRLSFMIAERYYNCGNADMRNAIKRNLRVVCRAPKFTKSSVDMGFIRTKSEAGVPAVY